MNDIVEGSEKMYKNCEIQATHPIFNVDSRENIQQ